MSGPEKQRANAPENEGKAPRQNTPQNRGNPLPVKTCAKRGNPLPVKPALPYVNKNGTNDSANDETVMKSLDSLGFQPSIGAKEMNANSGRSAYLRPKEPRKAIGLSEAIGEIIDNKDALTKLFLSQAGIDPSDVIQLEWVLPFPNHEYKLEYMSRGEWDDEPDYLLWKDRETGYYCCVIRGPFYSLNGYVGLPPQKVATGMDANDIPWERLQGDHGGLTYSSDHLPIPPDCTPVDLDYVFGFDCAHLGDYVPGIEAALKMSAEQASQRETPEQNMYMDLYDAMQSAIRTGDRPKETYRNFDYVISNLRKLTASFYQINSGYDDD